MVMAEDELEVIEPPDATFLLELRGKSVNIRPIGASVQDKIYMHSAGIIALEWDKMK